MALHALHPARSWFSETFLLPPAYVSFSLQAIRHGSKSAAGTHLCQVLAWSGSKYSVSSASVTCLSSKLPIFSGLRTPWHSCLSFSSPAPLFSSTCGLFCQNRGGGVRTRQEQPPGIYQRARIRYFRTEVPFLSTGTLNWAAKAAVLLNLYVEESISQSPPMGSLTSTVMGVSL